jgi:hypothetical protein
MAKKLYSSRDVVISHKHMRILREEGKLNLEIDEAIAQELATNSNVGPKGTSNIAFHLWSWVGIGGFAYTVYLSFTDQWWWFLVGLAALVIVHGANKKSLSQNYLDAAMDDAEFYERIRHLGGWQYELEEEIGDALIRLKSHAEESMSSEKADNVT